MSLTPSSRLMPPVFEDVAVHLMLGNHEAAQAALNRLKQGNAEMFAAIKRTTLCCPVKSRFLAARKLRESCQVTPTRHANANRRCTPP